MRCRCRWPLEGPVESYAGAQPMPSLKRAVLQLAGGAGLSQVILVAATPLLTRLFEPAQFGEYAMFASVFTIATAIATLKLEQAIVLPAERADAAALAKTAVACSAFAAMVVLAALAAVDVVATGVRIYHYLLPIAVLV